MDTPRNSKSTCRIYQSDHPTLANIQLPEHTEFFAGFVHEGRSLDELKIIRDHIESIRQHPVGIACACGLGRRTSETAERLMNLMKQLLY